MRNRNLELAALFICIALRISYAQCDFNLPTRHYPLIAYFGGDYPLTGPRKLFPIRLRIEGNTGFINKTGKVVIPPVYTVLDPRFREGFVVADTHDNYDLFITEEGKIWQPIPKRYSSMNYNDFSEELAAFHQVQREDDGNNVERRGYIDKTGAVKLGPLPLVALFDFHDGLALAADRLDHYGFIDKTGRWKIPPQYYEAGDFSEGFSAIDLCDHCRYIDKDGKQAFLGDFKTCKPFHGGSAQVRVSKDHWAFINTKGEIVGTLLNEKELSYYQSEGLMPSQKDYSGPLGFVNTQGEFVIPPRFLQVEAFSEGLAAVTEDGLHWGYIDHSGKYVIPPSFHKPFQLEVGFFNEGLAFACNQNNLCGFIDKTGKWALPPKYEPCEADPGGYCGFNGGLAWVRTKQIEGYINPQGHFVWYQKAHPPDHTPPPPPPEPKH